jgi:DNA/RNA endonuclease YhcR with UshA esterase domain
MPRFAVLLALNFVSLALIFVAPARGQDAQTPPATQPSTQPSGDAIDVAEFEKLKGMIGQDATIRGTVTEVFTPSSGTVKIFNFEGIERRAFNVVVRKDKLDAVNAGFGGDVEAAVRGKTITVTGKIVDYRGNPQMQLEKPEQMKIEEATGPAEEKPAENRPD